MGFSRKNSVLLFIEFYNFPKKVICYQKVDLAQNEIVVSISLCL